MSLRVTFSNSINFTVIHEYGKDAVRDIEYVDCRGVLWNGTF